MAFPSKIFLFCLFVTGLISAIKGKECEIDMELAKCRGAVREEKNHLEQLQIDHGLLASRLHFCYRKVDNLQKWHKNLHKQYTEDADRAIVEHQSLQHTLSRQKQDLKSLELQWFESLAELIAEESNEVANAANVSEIVDRLKLEKLTCEQLFENLKEEKNELEKRYASLQDNFSQSTANVSQLSEAQSEKCKNDLNQQNEQCKNDLNQQKEECMQLTSNIEQCENSALELKKLYETQIEKLRTDVGQSQQKCDSTIQETIGGFEIKINDISQKLSQANDDLVKSHQAQQNQANLSDEKIRTLTAKIEGLQKEYALSEVEFENKIGHWEMKYNQAIEEKNLAEKNLDDAKKIASEEWTEEKKSIQNAYDQCEVKEAECETERNKELEKYQEAMQHINEIATEIQNNRDAFKPEFIKKVSRAMWNDRKHNNSEQNSTEILGYDWSVDQATPPPPPPPQAASSINQAVAQEDQTVAPAAAASPSINQTVAQEDQMDADVANDKSMDKDL